MGLPYHSSQEVLRILEALIVEQETAILDWPLAFPVAT
jgi:hypothetical protein